MRKFKKIKTLSRPYHEKYKGKGPTQGLDVATLTADFEDSINFLEQGNKFCLSLHYNGSNSFLLVNGGRRHRFKAKDSELVIYLMCLRSISKDFLVGNMKEKRTKWIGLWFFN